MWDQPCAKKAYSRTMPECPEQGYLSQGMATKMGCPLDTLSTCSYRSLSSLPLMF